MKVDVVGSTMGAEVLGIDHPASRARRQFVEVARRMITLRLGLEMEHAALRFWRAVADEEDGADATAR